MNFLTIGIQEERSGNTVQEMEAENQEENSRDNSRNIKEVATIQNSITKIENWEIEEPEFLLIQQLLI